MVSARAAAVTLLVRSFTRTAFTSIPALYLTWYAKVNTNTKGRSTPSADRKSIPLSLKQQVSWIYFMTPEQFAAKMERRQKALIQNVISADAKTLDTGKKAAAKLSSGDLTTADLRRAGRPYARRQPNSRYAPYRINKQTGDYLRGWKTKPPSLTGSVIKSLLYNDSHVAEFLVNGTKTMVSRDQRSQILIAVRKVRKKYLVAAVIKTLKRS